MNGGTDLNAAVADLVRSLPPLDDSVELLLRQAAGGGAEAGQLADAVAGDSGLCADLLALANASCIPRAEGKPVQTVEEALRTVGPQVLAELVGTRYVFDAVRAQCAAPGRWDDYVRHSRDIADSARRLARERGLDPAECARYAVAGLTHDIGRVVMMAAAGDLSSSLLGTSPEKMRRIVRDEQRAYRLDHCRIGEMLYRRWGLSPIMREGILRHHTPMLPDSFSFPGGLIFVAHFVGMSDFTGDILARVLSPRLLDSLGLTVGDIERARSAALPSPA